MNSPKFQVGDMAAVSDKAHMRHGQGGTVEATGYLGDAAAQWYADVRFDDGAKERLMESQLNPAVKAESATHEGEFKPEPE